MPLTLKDYLTSPLADIRTLYARLDEPLAALDCGQQCARHNPAGKPFCCDICHAVPAAYPQEWTFLQKTTNLWQPWRGDECSQSDETRQLQLEQPENMLYLACLGPQACQRPFRALSCRQFPFFPYVSTDYRFLGLACEWEFESVCWVISHLEAVTEAYRHEFIATHDRLFALEQDIFEAYAAHSEKMRAEFARTRRRIPLLHRDGGFRLISPASERMARISAAGLPRFGFYK